MRLNTKIIVSFILIMMSVGFVFSQAQPYNNEWIVPGQSYYKIPVGKTGLYGLKISARLGTVDTSKIQIWRRGKEQAILVKGDSVFFYGEINDGAMDSALYLSGFQPHKYYSLYTDTSAYFLTLGASNGKRMTQINSSTTAQPAAGFHINQDLLLFTDTYDEGHPYSQQTFLSEFDMGEGWFGSPLASTPTPYTVDGSYIDSTGPLPELEIMLVGRNINQQGVEISYGTGSAKVDTVVNFSDHSTFKYKATVAFGSFSPDLTITFKQVAASGYASLAYIKVNFPQACDMQGKTEKYFTLPQNSQDTTLIRISNPSSAAAVFDITDINNVRLIVSGMQSGLLSAIVPDMASGARNLYVSSTVLPVTGMKSVDLSEYSAAGNYIIITHETLDSSAQIYANYRRSLPGGGLNVVVTEINKLYNLFSYGEKSPLAVRHFAKYLLDHGDPQYLFLLGKGISVNSSNNISNNLVYYRKDPLAYKTNPDIYYNQLTDDLIPPAGYPGSDILFTMGLDTAQGSYMPAIATGRVAAKNNNEVMNYLNKVKEHEMIDSNWLWRKNLIHVSGGDDAFQISDFKSWINGPFMKGVAEGPIFGGKVVKSFSKVDPGSVDDSFRSSISDEINKGVSYLTFLGHASPSVTDVDIGFVSFPIYGYQNQGKYPMLLLNGCSSSNVFNYYSTSEDWIVTPKKGAIAVIGHTDIGYPFLLESYSQSLYQTAFANNQFIDKPLGLIQKQVLKLFIPDNINSSYNKELAQANLEQMILHADPFIRIYHPGKPDYSIITEGDQEQVIFIKSYNSQPVTAVSDSFAIGIVVTNFGQASAKDSFAVTVQRTINNKTVVTYGPVMYPTVYYQDTIYFKIKSHDATTFGENSFSIKVDALDSISEMNEGNNGALFDYFIPLSSVIPLMPQEYSIVNNSFLLSDTITLVAQATDLMIAPTDFYFEIDTSYLFKSPLDKGTINSGALIKWKTSSVKTTEDSVVYYWRVRFANIPAGQDTLWGESSFIFIGGSPEGWSQSEYPQFTKDNRSQINLHVPQNNWSFDTVSTNVHLESIGIDNDSSTANISIDGRALFFAAGGGCGGRGIIAMAFDKSTALPVVPSGFDNYACGRQLAILRSFRKPADNTVTGDGTALIAYLDSIPSGDYIFLVANGVANFTQWDPALKNKIETELGATLLNSLQDSCAYILMAKKGTGSVAPVPLVERYSNVNGTRVILDTTFTGIYNKGTVTSTLIGPTTKWGSMFRNISTPNGSEYTLKVMRLNLDGSVKDINAIPPFGYKFDLDSFFHTLSDTSLYPYIKLVAELSDSNLTAPQLNKWQVVYRGVPEGTIDPIATGNVGQYNFFTKEEGESVPLTFAFENISNLDFSKPVKVRFTITNQSGQTMTDTLTLAAIQKGNQVIFNYTINSKGFVGNNLLQVFVNPYDQPEQYFDNNIQVIAFNIEKDKTNPILDVAFDGQHIMNGDIVSPSPLISINLNDENKYLIKNDTLNMQVFLQSPGQATPAQINMSSSDIISWGHVAGSTNTFRIEYNPKNLPDGVYTLIVQGSDVSGNKSGTQRYEIKFEVINEVSITYFYPYPNPFSTSTRFVFTLTGNEIPEDMKIQIMTVTGKVVREITKNEIGPIHIGNNKTEYAWDGTDEFGDRLANGVYLYRVILKGADDFKHRKTAADKAFKKDWGKLYILR